MFKLIWYIMTLPFRILFLPFKILGSTTEINKKEFDEEANLLGLSKEDREIAKNERMTPSEYIEAEEYDDDELLKDEWER